MMRRRILALFVVTILAAFEIAAEEKIDYPMIQKIREEGFQRSQVMEIAGYMTDVLGPRFSNSPGYTRAAHWARQKFAEFGLAAFVEAYGEVGPGWEVLYTSAHMHTPQYMPFIAYAKPYCRSTPGKVVSDVVWIDFSEIRTEAELEAFRGRLRGKIVFTKPQRVLGLNFKPAAARLSAAELRDMAKLRILAEGEGAGDAYGAKTARQTARSLAEERIHEFLEEEGAAVLVEPGSPQGEAPMDKGLVHVSAPRPPALGDPKALPGLIVAAEHYNRVIRILERGVPVKMEAEIRVNWEEADLRDFNVIAELPGMDLADEIVMIGGHYDGEPAGTGATDNAAGCAVVMEAMRILKVTGARPRRTIRAALWGGEEAGHLGSSGYVAAHFGGPEPDSIKPEHARLSGYFNVDWYGCFRGIYLQGNDLVRPIFAKWMEPFHDVGMTTLVPGNTGGTDHMDFVKAGLPGFQFIQDDLEFFTTTFHTNMDVFDRLVEEDLAQAAVILAAFAYNAATREGRLPRTPLQMKNNRRWHK